MTTTPNMSLVLPTDHDSDELWGAIVNTVLGLVDSHNHTAGRGVKVPTGGISIDADMSFAPTGTPHAITDLKAIDFTPTAASGVTGLAGAFFVSDGTGGLILNELYYRTVLGTNVQVTLGAGLNVAAFAGGIGGDYIAASALLSYDAATLSYWHQQPGAPRPWARMRSGDVDIYETAASITNRVRLKSPGALAASYDVTWPAAVPASTSLVQMANTGVLTASNATIGGTPNFTGAVTMASTLGVTGTVTASGAMTVGTTLGVTGNLTASAAATVGTTLGVTGLITATGGLTTGAAAGIAMTGGADLHHPARTFALAASEFIPAGLGTAIATSSVFEAAALTAPARTYSATWRFGATGDLYAPVPLRAGDRITSMQACYVAENNVNAVTIALVCDDTAGAASVTRASFTASGLSVKTGSSTITPNYTLLTTDIPWLRVLCNDASGANGTHLVGVTVSWDRP